MKKIIMLRLKYIAGETQALPRGSDCWGAGHFGASRGSRTHNGKDILVPAGSQVLSVASGIVTKLGWCYSGEGYRYVEVSDDRGNRVRHFYVSPHVEIGVVIESGDLIGVSQDLACKYQADSCMPIDMPNHVHLEVMSGTNSKTFFDPDEYEFT
jgi:murein DD-endopeptidase MepM/ murein hydrolase activator NlpD